MHKHFLLLALLSSFKAYSSLSVSGYAESGLSIGWSSVRGSSQTLYGNQWLLDNLQLQLNYSPEPRWKLYFRNAMSVASPTQSPTSAYSNTRNYYSPKAQFSQGGFTFSNLEAFIEYDLGSNISLGAGHLRTPHGLETQIDRVDMATYYYSNSYMAMQVFGWQYDLGFKLKWEDVLAGRMELAYLDCRYPGAKRSGYGDDVSSPCFAFRYDHKDSGPDHHWLAAVSLYMGKFRRRPEDVGWTVGSYYKKGIYRINFEYLFASTMTSYTSDLATANANPGVQYVGDYVQIPPSLNILGQAKSGHRAQAWSIYVEPGISLGDIGDFSAKFEYGNHEYEFAKEDINLALGWTKSLSEKTKLRWVYQHFNMLNALAEHANETRVLLSMKF